MLFEKKILRINCLFWQCLFMVFFLFQSGCKDLNKLSSSVELSPKHAKKDFEDRKLDAENNDEIYSDESCFEDDDWASVVSDRASDESCFEDDDWASVVSDRASDESFSEDDDWASVVSDRASDESCFEDDDWVFVEKPEVSSKRFSAMIEEGEFGVTLNPHFIAMAPSLLDLVELSYIVSNGEGVSSQLPWDIKTFRAISGVVFNDNKTGFVAYLPSDRDFLPPWLQDDVGPVMVVVFHGSISKADWVTNLEALPIDSDDSDPSGFQFQGKVHRGFLRKYRSASQELMNLIDDQLKVLSEEQRRQLKIYVTGHSQGAALSQLAIGHIVQHLSAYHPDLLDEDLSNQKINRVNGWFIAAPEVFDSQGKTFIEDTWVGRNNMIRQNARGDAVPNLTQPLNKLTGSSYSGIGVLLYQNGLETVKKATQCSAYRVCKKRILKGLLKVDVLGALRNIALDLTQVAATAPHFVAKIEGQKHGFTPDMVHSNLGEMEKDFYQGQSYQEAGWYKEVLSKLWSYWPGLLSL